MNTYCKYCFESKPCNCDKGNYSDEQLEILETYKWIKVPKYKDDDKLTWEERFKRLEEHHITETTFLIEKVRELIRK